MPFPAIEIKTVLFWIFAITSASFLAAAGQYAFRKFWYRDDKERRSTDHISILPACATSFAALTETISRTVASVETRAAKYVPIVEKHETEIAVLQEQHRNIMAALSRIEAAVEKLKK